MAVVSSPPSRARPCSALFSIVATIFMIQSASCGPAQDYMLYCMGCHGAQAQGVAGKVPPLARALGRFMRSPEGRNYVLRVPGAANSVLSDTQLAAVLNWVAASFDAGDLAREVPWFTPQEVTQSRHVPLASVSETRRAVVQSLASTGLAPGADY
jgi:cytochrome c553